MIISIDSASSEALYMQIRQQIVAAIARGELLPGDSLPSVRSLASDLGVNLHTVNKAYALLHDEGYLVMRGRSGAFVAEPSSQSAPARAMLIGERVEKELLNLVYEHKAAGGSEEAFLAEVQRACKEVYGDIDSADMHREVRVLGVDDTGEPLRRNCDQGYRSCSQGLV